MLLPEGLRVFIATLPQGEDPDTLLVSKGAAALSDLVDSASDALDVVIRDAGAIGASPADQADAVAGVAPLVALVPDPVERVAWARKLAVATDTQLAAVQVIVREAVRRGGPVDAERVSEALGQRAVRRLSTEERQLRQLATLFFHHPKLAQGYSPARMESLLPEGQWRRLIAQLAAAADAGCVDESGAFDMLALEGHLEGEMVVRMREVAIDDAFLEGHSSPVRIRDDLIRWFAKRQRSNEGKNVTRQMGSAESDALRTLLAEKQRQLEERRAALAAESESRR